MLTEAEAREIVAGIQSGDVDELDLLGLVDDAALWLAESDSQTAGRIRARRLASAGSRA